jgi:hypothetical protein
MCSSKNLAQPRKTISELAAYYAKNPSWQNAPVDSPLRPFYRSRVTRPSNLNTEPVAPVKRKRDMHSKKRPLDRGVIDLKRTDSCLKGDTLEQDLRASQSTSIPRVTSSSSLPPHDISELMRKFASMRVLGDGVYYSDLTIRVATVSAAIRTKTLPECRGMIRKYNTIMGEANKMCVSADTLYNCHEVKKRFKILMAMKTPKKEIKEEYNAIATRTQDFVKKYPESSEYLLSFLAELNSAKKAYLRS